jgi:hypothetical protein
VKADVKLLIYEWEIPPTENGPDPKLKKMLLQYLQNYELLTPKEAFVFLQYRGFNPSAYWWKPLRTGTHKDTEIKFQLLNLSTK